MLAKSFSFVDKGNEVNFELDAVHSDRGYRLTLALTHFGSCPTSRELNPNCSTIHAHTLCLCHRFLAYLLSFNVMPQTSSLNEVRNCDIYILFKLVVDEVDHHPVPLGGLIL